MTPTADPPLRLRTFALAAIAQTLIGSAPDAREPELDFLRSQLTAATATAPTWQQGLKTYLAQPLRRDIPLLKLSRDFHLTLLEMLSVALAAAVEDDVLVGRALARVQAPLGGSRPTLSLIATAFRDLSHPRAPIPALLNGVAVQSGLLTILNSNAPLPERTLSIPTHLCFAFDHLDATVPGTTLGFGTMQPVPLADSLLTAASQYANSFKADPHRLLSIRTGSAIEGRSVAAALTKSLNRRPLFIESSEHLPDGLAPWLYLRRLVPVFCLDLAPGDRHSLPAIPHYAGPVLALCGPDGSLSAPDRDTLTWALPIPARAERQALWQLAIDNAELAAELARNHRHSSDRIAQIGRIAHHYSSLNHHPQPTAEDICSAAWSGEGIGLDALAQPLTQIIPDEALVMQQSLQKDLHTLLQRCRARDNLTDGLGASATTRYYPGVKALFVGPSGTGKTLAAGWLATQLAMPLYRVDLAAVVSKYIGETEKNLAQLLARAERAEVVLLFDEADSLFGKRTDVQQANDRFANTQTNYLLQRIESYDGITLLTSNSRQRFDSAFSRRLDMVIEFPQPRSQERRTLWQSHLGDRHALTPEQLNQLATTSELCGGHIRNAVLAAAVLAQAGDRPIQFNDIVQGLSAEYRKLGRQPPAALQTSGGA
ncbi:ATP-binding protein [Leptothoe sp. PORK10 BA2]|uniref:ATP-binding protein n=1 Tax=Leptothoe sp. PORK10 BA2 TaxID=3110254 RepID=UPI002B21C9CB|nr:AAA family ATPase [Leptothoe sp. PORK10 BA2]MEA5463932.1 AAA family ATPase [Leptothoe sp. PORK10 BA2]